VNEVPLKQAMAELLSGEPATAVDANRALASGKAARRSRWVKVSAAGAVLAVALAAAIPASRSWLVGDQANPGPAGHQKVAPAPTRTAPYEGYPDSIAVIGHSTAAGYHSDPTNIAATIPENSWATGTNPQVNSLYERILARHPAIKDHNLNLAGVNLGLGESRDQASRAVAQQPPPDLVVMQVLDNDIGCPADAEALALFRSAVVGALQTLQQYAPHTRVFVFSQFGGSTSVIQALSPDERKAFGRSIFEFSCAIVDPNGRVIPSQLKEFQTAIHGYEAELKAACSQFTTCTYDNGAFDRVALEPGDPGPDFDHLSVQGQAHAADAAWKALQDAGLLPPD
jgi:hypothetical protein